MLINSPSFDVVCEAFQIATRYLKETGQFPAGLDINQPLFDCIVWDFRAGNGNKLRLANRAIARIESANGLLEFILQADDISRTYGDPRVALEEGESEAAYG
jgi:hypothetical protein